MVVLVIVAVACFAAGIWAATTWLPPLAEGSVGTLIYFVVCGLAGAALVIFGVHVWEIVRELEQNYRPILGNEAILASSLVETLWQSGTIAALAVIPYLLAPKATAQTDPRTPVPATLYKVK